MATTEVNIMATTEVNIMATTEVNAGFEKDLKLMIMIRQFERMLLDLFAHGKLNGTTHTCLGQEYIPVALKPCIREGDYEFSNHRGHGHYLARFEDPVGLLAEIMGKEGAVCKGVGGSQHIHREDYMSTGIQGESMPVAVGVALYYKRVKNKGLAVVHIGDGTWGEGSVYESLNMAKLWNLPLLVACENNHVSQSTPLRLQMSGSIEDRVKSFGVTYQKIESIYLDEIREVIKPLIDNARDTVAPVFLEFETLRLGPHSKGDDERDPEEQERIKKKDWYEQYRNKWTDLFDRIEAEVKNELQSMLEDVEQRPFTKWSPTAS